MKNRIIRKNENKERGSASLEQMLFVMAVVAISGGVYAFYDRIEVFFQNQPLPAGPDGQPAGSSSN
jgi:hypothetical protein